MKNTPRKRVLVEKAREQTRFLQYLFARAGYVALSVACIGWLASAGSQVSSEHDVTKKMSIEKWASRLGTFDENIKSNGDFTDESLSLYYHTQDIMSCQLLLSLITQLMTMLERGQELHDLFEMLSESLFVLGSFFAVVVHIIVLTIRASLRINGFALYQYMRFDVWVAMVIFPLFGLIVGTVVNALDEKGYRRYMQFLRLEFDTKLGMHSPK